MKALLSHIQDQQDKARRLTGLLEAIDRIRRTDDGAMTTLIEVARETAEELFNSLDSTRLPKGVGA